MKQYILSLSIVLGMMLFASCSEEDRTFYEGDDSVQALFQVKALKYEMTEDDSDSIKIQVFRGNTKGAVDVDLALTFEEGTDLSKIFSLTSTKVSFADGVNVTEAIIKFDFSKFGVTDLYKMTLSIANEDQFPVFTGGKAAFTSIDLQVKRKLTFETYAVGTYTSSFFGEAWEQELAVAKEDPNVFRLTNCYYKDYSIFFVLDDKHEKIVGFDKQEMGYLHSTYGMTSVSLVGQKVTAEEIKFTFDFTVAAGSFGEMDEVFTFPKK